MEKNVFVLPVKIILTICIFFNLLLSLYELPLGIVVLSGICFLASCGMLIQQSQQLFFIGIALCFTAYLIKYIPILLGITREDTVVFSFIFAVCGIYALVVSIIENEKQKI